MSSMKNFYDNTFKIYQVPIFEHNVLMIEYKDTSKWMNPVRIYETNGSSVSEPTLHKFLTTSQYVDPSTRYRYFNQKCNSVYTITNILKNKVYNPIGFDETLDEVMTYIHNPPQSNELLLVNHKTDIAFDLDIVNKKLFPQLSKKLNTVTYTSNNSSPNSIIIWVSTTSTTQIPIAHTFTYNTTQKPIKLYFIITSEHEIPPSVSSILPFTQKRNTDFNRNENMTSIEFTFEKNTKDTLQSSLLKKHTPEILYYNNELDTRFTTSETIVSSSLIRINNKFTPSFGRNFYMAVPLTEYNIVALTVSNISFLDRSTIYHLDASTISQVRSPITLPSTKLTEADIYAMKCYFDTYLSNTRQQQLTNSPSSTPSPPLFALNSHVHNARHSRKNEQLYSNGTLLELKNRLEDEGILIKHPEVGNTLSNMITEQTSKTSAHDIHYDKVLKLFELLTDTNDKNKIYQLLDRKVKSFIVKVDLKNSLPIKRIPQSALIKRNYSMEAPDIYSF